MVSVLVLSPLFPALRIMVGLSEKTFLAASIIFSTFAPQSTPSASSSDFLVPREYVYVVMQGDSLSSIAKDKYGSSDYWTTVWNDNEWIDNPNLLYSEWKLMMRINKPLTVEPLHEDLTKRQGSVVEQTFSQVDSGKTESEGIPTPEVVNASQADEPVSNFENVYKEAGEKYGVPWQILYGIHLTETGLRDGQIFNHQGSGAQGPMQFMPGTWSAYGVDGNGDGVADIDNAIDAIHGAANFLAKHGDVMNGLRYYGGNTAGTLTAARTRGFEF